MKKLIALLSLVALTVWTFGPALTVATGDVDTSLTPKTGGGLPPIVKVKWEMKDTRDTGSKWLGQDDSSALYAQFNAPGTWGSTMNYVVCAVATDPDTHTTTPITGVYADIYYPKSLYPSQSYYIPAIHPDSSKPDLIDGGVPTKPDYGLGGCGAFIEENTLIKLSKEDGYELFCNKIQSNNNLLPKFATGYDYSEVCYELDKGEAAVYCDAKTLKWEDPSGKYKVEVVAQDVHGVSPKLTNEFEYVALTKFEVDFGSIKYGDVFLSTKKIISGDKTFSDSGYCSAKTTKSACESDPACYWSGVCSNKPTVRNLGNTRLYMKVAQDDMGLGQSSSVWNVEYDARVGSNDADWEIYNPFGPKSTTPTSTQYTQLEDILDLSEEEEMDFSIHVKKWPDPTLPTNYTGNMWLTASQAMFRVCP